MLNYIWALLLLFGIISAVITGRMESISQAVLSGAKEAVNLSISMVGIMGFWMGLMKIAENTGITKGMTKLIYPLLHFLFPRYKKESKTLQAISMNVTANLLGLGNAATPFGLKAMKEMSDNKISGVATYEMRMFVLINTASLQILPTTLIALRQEYNSKDPFEIIPIIWLVSLVVLLSVVLLAKLLEQIKSRDKK